MNKKLIFELFFKYFHAKTSYNLPLYLVFCVADSDYQHNFRQYRNLLLFLLKGFQRSCIKGVGVAISYRPGHSWLDSLA
jgi:hypothetical protein